MNCAACVSQLSRYLQDKKTMVLEVRIVVTFVGLPLGGAQGRHWGLVMVCVLIWVLVTWVLVTL